MAPIVNRQDAVEASEEENQRVSTLSSKSSYFPDPISKRLSFISMSCTVTL